MTKALYFNGQFCGDVPLEPTEEQIREAISMWSNVNGGSLDALAHAVELPTWPVDCCNPYGQSVRSSADRILVSIGMPKRVYPEVGPVSYIAARYGAAGATVRYEIDGTHTGPLDPRHDLANHSPDGFEWGYGGSGPAQLALAILAHYYAPDDLAALRFYQRFKSRVIAHIDQRRDEWELSEVQIKACMRSLWLAGAA